MSYSLTFSKAVIMVLFVADKVRQGQYDFVPTKVISESLNIAGPTAVKIIQGLNRSALIETREGSKGGIRLAKQPENITVLDIFEAIEINRPLFRDDFNINVTGVKPTRGQQAISGILNDAEAAMKNQLRATTIADLINHINQ